MDFARICCSAVPLFFHVKKIYVNDNAKKKLRGGMFIAANHTCMIDPLLLCLCFWYRRMFYLAAESVMKNKLTKALLKGLGCIEINRNICDIESITKAVKVVSQGHTLAIFPQGAISTEDDMNTIKSGIILMAMRAKAPIVPCYIHNKEKKGDKRCIVIGEPLEFFCENPFPGLKDIDRFANTVMEKMSECKKIYEESRRS